MIPAVPETVGAEIGDGTTSLVSGFRRFRRANARERARNTMANGRSDGSPDFANFLTHP